MDLITARVHWCILILCCCLGATNVWAQGTRGGAHGGRQLAKDKEPACDETKTAVGFHHETF